MLQDGIEHPNNAHKDQCINNLHHPMQPMNLLHDFGSCRGKIQLIYSWTTRHLVCCVSNSKTKSYCKIERCPILTFPKKCILFSVYCREQSSKHATKCPKKNAINLICIATIIGLISLHNTLGYPSLIQSWSRS